jgi:polyferredoxin
LAQYRPTRHFVQIATIVATALAGAVGLLRIDLANGSFTLLGRQIHWSNFDFTFGLGLLLVTAPIITYMTIGTVWCGWACPQNTLSEWANNLTRRLLGKRASVDLGDRLQVAPAKNRILNWMLLALIFLAASLGLSLIPFLFFYSPDEAWRLLAHPSRADVSMLVLYFVITFFIFIDIAVVRHFVCDYACAYRIGQHIFKTRDALHIAYDRSRSSECAKCNYCAVNCITAIRPTEIRDLDPCINCGECIDACDRLQQKSGKRGLLSFRLGDTTAAPALRSRIMAVGAKFNWLVGGIFMLGLIMTVRGVVVADADRPYVPTVEDRHALQLSQACQAHCALQLAACKGGDMAGCYRAAACQCQCQLDHDPAGANAEGWRQCVRRNGALAADARGAAPAR